MNYCIYNGTFIAVPSRSDELKHYGVPGMRWGARKQQDTVVGAGGRRSYQDTNSFRNARSYQGANSFRSAGSSSGATYRQARAAARNTPEAKAARAAKAKKALKIGAAVAGTALAAYGGYKLAKYVQERRNQAAFQKAQDYVNQNVFRKVGDTAFVDGTRMMDFRDGMGNKITTEGVRSNVGKAVGQHNAQVVAKGRQMYKDATNTRFDRGLAKVVNAGDAVENAAKNAAKNAGNAAKNAAKNAGNAAKKAANAAKNSKAGQAVRNTKNKVLDVVNPIYEYTPHVTRTSRPISNLPNGVTGTHTEEIIEYIKSKKRRT